MFMVKKYGEYISGGFLILFGMVVLLSSQNIKRMAGVSVGSDFFPKIAAVMLIAFGVIIITSFIWNRNRRTDISNTTQAPEADEAMVEVGSDWKAPLISAILLTFYVGLLGKVGFLIMTILYLFMQITVLAPKKKRNYVLFGGIAVGVTLIVYFLFVRILSVMLPAGLLG